MLTEGLVKPLFTMGLQVAVNISVWAVRGVVYKKWKWVLQWPIAIHHVNPRIPPEVLSTCKQKLGTWSI